MPFEIQGCLYTTKRVYIAFECMNVLKCDLYFDHRLLLLHILMKMHPKKVRNA